MGGASPGLVVLGDMRKQTVENLSIDSRYPKTMLLVQRIFICPRGTKDRDKGQRQEIENEGEGKRNKGAGPRGKGLRERLFVLQWRQRTTSEKRGESRCDPYANDSL